MTEYRITADADDGYGEWQIKRAIHADEVYSALHTIAEIVRQYHKGWIGEPEAMTRIDAELDDVRYLLELWT